MTTGAGPIPSSKREIAILGRTDGTSFVDVTDPANPRYLGDLPKTKGSPSAAWRDMKVVKDHAFIVADNAGEHGMQVFDLTRLRNVTHAANVHARCHVRPHQQRAQHRGERRDGFCVRGWWFGRRRDVRRRATT